jgi:hypothetical protein
LRLAIWTALKAQLAVEPRWDARRLAIMALRRGASDANGKVSAVCREALAMQHTHARALAATLFEESDAPILPPQPPLTETRGVQCTRETGVDAEMQTDAVEQSVAQSGDAMTQVDQSIPTECLATLARTESRDDLMVAPPVQNHLAGSHVLVEPESDDRTVGMELEQIVHEPMVEMTPELEIEADAMESGDLVLIDAPPAVDEVQTPLWSL